MRSALLPWLFLAACSTPALDAKPFACTTDSQCGTGYVCALDGRCVDAAAPIGDGRITVSIESGTRTSEAGVVVTLRVKLSSEPKADVVLRASTSDPTEATVAPASALLTARDWSTGALFTVTGVDDAELDGAVDYLVTFSSSSEDPRFSDAPVGVITLTNDDDDSPAILARSLESTSTEAGGAARVAVRLGARPSAAVTVSVSIDANDVTPSVTSLAFTPADFATEQVVTLTGKDDHLADGDQSYVLSLSAAGASEYHGLTAEVTLRSLDGVCNNGLVDGVEACDGALNAACVTAENPSPSEQRCGADCQCGGPAVIVRPSGPSTTEAGGVVSLSLSLRTRPESAVTVSLSSLVPDDEVGVAPTSVTFNATNYAQPQVITVTGRDDRVADGHQTVTIVLDITSTDPIYKLLTIAPIQLENRDDDVVGIRLVKVDGVSTEAGESASFTVALTSEPTGSVDLVWIVSPTGETTETSGTLSFDASNWSSPKAYTLIGKDDHLADGDRSYTVTVSRLGGTAAEYTNVASASETFQSIDGVCGNGLIDGAEVCDGDDRDGCVEHGIVFGDTSCSAGCDALSLSGCGWQFVQVASSQSDTGCAVRASGELVCWGQATTFNPGTAPVRKVVMRPYSSSNPAICALSTEGTLSQGTSFCGVRADGTVACWGANASNTLGTVPTGDDFVFVSVARSARAAYAVRRSGEVVGFGSGAVRLLP